ncbi:MAG: hypothetical protein Q8N60_05010 [Candidatus Diapherotrites archaeon]|nr:hypothetical protein [Candidatus Diapherotrites archaeon]
MKLEEKAALKHEKMKAKWEKRAGFTGKHAKWKAKWDKWLGVMDKKLEADKEPEAK